MSAWLSVVGLGEDGAEGLSPAAAAAVRGAAHVFGGTRHLALARPLIGGEAHAWPSPFDTTMAAVREKAGTPTCVLASGDPFQHGVGVTLARVIAPQEMRVFPAPSAFSLAAARLGWALQDALCLSLHGRPVSLLRPHLQDRARLLVLTSDGDGPAAIAALLARSGFPDSRVHVLEALGGPHERVGTHAAAALAAAPPDHAALNLVAVEVVAGPQAVTLPLTPGLPDDLFEHDGQITKSAIRAVTLAALAPRPGELLWDVGAGSGSIAIEWMLRAPSCRAIAIEAEAERAARIARNADALGVPGLTVLEGEAPGALAGLPAPDAVFLGGGAGDPALAEAAMTALRPGGRLVANAVTLETESVLAGLHAAHGGQMLRLALGHATPVGTMRGWRAAMPVTQWRWQKPVADGQAGARRT